MSAPEHLIKTSTFGRATIKLVHHTEDITTSRLRRGNCHHDTFFNQCFVVRVFIGDTKRYGGALPTEKAALLLFNQFEERLRAYKDGLHPDPSYDHAWGCG